METEDVEKEKVALEEKERIRMDQEEQTRQTAEGSQSPQSEDVSSEHNAHFRGNRRVEAH